MLGLALGTTAAWAVFDAAWFARRESDDYRRWAARLARWLFVGSAVWTGIAGTCYIACGWSASLRQTMFSGPLLVLTAVTGVAPLVPAVWMWLRRQPLISRGEAALLALAQLLVLAVNAISRQVVQNLELRPYLDVAVQPTNVQWSPVIVFLLLCVAGRGVSAWMGAKAVEAVQGGACGVGGGE